MGDHPALSARDGNPHSRWHQPIGVFGDDAKYTLAGRKVIILLVSSVLQKIERTLAYLRQISFTFYNSIIIWELRVVSISQEQPGQVHYSNCSYLIIFGYHLGALLCDAKDWTWPGSLFFF